MAGPTNAELQRQIDQLRKDNTDEHNGVKVAINDLAGRFTHVEKLLAEHELSIYGKEGEGGLIRQVARAESHTGKVERELNATKLGNAIALVMFLAGIVAAKLEGMI